MPKKKVSNKKILDLEKKQLKELEELESSIKKEFGSHPLKRITFKDLTKGVIGAFVGIVSHFAFIEGSHIAQQIDINRAFLLYLTSFLLGTILIYFSGYRRVKQVKFLRLMPLRIVLIYFTALLSVIVVLFLFNQITTTDMLFKQVATISIPAVIGASVADLIGK